MNKSVAGIRKNILCFRLFCIYTKLPPGTLPRPVFGCINTDRCK